MAVITTSWSCQVFWAWFLALPQPRWDSKERQFSSFTWGFKNHTFLTFPLNTKTLRPQADIVCRGPKLPHVTWMDDFCPYSSQYPILVSRSSHGPSLSAKAGFFRRPPKWSGIDGHAREGWRKTERGDSFLNENDWQEELHRPTGVTRAFPPQEAGIQTNDLSQAEQRPGFYHPVSGQREPDLPTKCSGSYKSKYGLVFAISGAWCVSVPMVGRGSGKNWGLWCWLCFCPGPWDSVIRGDPISCNAEVLSSTWFRFSSLFGDKGPPVQSVCVVNWAAVGRMKEQL